MFGEQTTAGICKQESTNNGLSGDPYLNLGSQSLRLLLFL